MVLGLLWLLDAVLQAAPALFTADWWRTDLAQSVMGEPMPITHSIFWAVNIIAAHPVLWNSVFVAAQVAFGLALVAGRFDRVAILASIPWALAVWWVGEGLGTIPTGFALLAAGSPGPVLLYPLIGILAWPTRQRPREKFSYETARSAVCQRTGLTVWLVLWAGQALLQIPWSIPTARVFAANVEEYSQGQPGWLGAVARMTTTVTVHHAVTLSIGLAIAQVAIGLGVFVPQVRRFALTAAIVLSLVFWFAFQYLGGIAGGDATDPGSAPLMILLAVSLWPSWARESKPRIRLGGLRRQTPTLSAAAA